eukprot:Gregarina_sp_Pseudo_9__2458@NODE_2745_length_887_cov_5_020047_g2511_i0_p2_GENE_NODE_2745_length_887_cov_5_020047_g2511_i0NODE_2745_length_887_cov_5_020047_g2511_i0_p2_ORF_typecomplete_len111_score34_18_NODE_2745_length_887_cov_5_020047_g2511_i0177509
MGDTNDLVVCDGNAVVTDTCCRVPGRERKEIVAQETGRRLNGWALGAAVGALASQKLPAGGKLVVLTDERGFRFSAMELQALQTQAAHLGQSVDVLVLQPPTTEGKALKN